MTFATAADDTRLYYEESGSGVPLLFIHEFAGDLRGWEPQLRAFARRYRCIAYNARGYPPSGVPEAQSSYSQELAVTDALAVLDHAGVDETHVVGLSMGGFTALHLGMRYPERVRSLVVAGCGYGSHPARAESFREECSAIASAFESEGADRLAVRYASGPARVQFQNKDPRGWAEFAARLAEHAVAGAAATIRGVQRDRPLLYDLRDELAAVAAPTLVITGDEDEGCLEPALMLKRTMRSAGLVVMPRTGHTCNLEEPDLFNRVVGDFLHAVEVGAWTARDPRSLVASTTGIDASEQ